MLRYLMGYSESFHPKFKSYLKKIDKSVTSFIFTPIIFKKIGESLRKKNITTLEYTLIYLFKLNIII